MPGPVVAFQAPRFRFLLGSELIQRAQYPLIEGIYLRSYY